ncbi:hypothetical protein ENSA5_10940 [Enhygromyxa salina]|uniref:Lipoprotein n=1 Tax=Enhygromyxa salina TaxID=215803 RepID=A0A2S9YGA0_9BACT|nr:hypothetical protein [Enhygromyxa salina]PRQ04046.1 hypothetical protein ENSA5_10940 [Enhygromyxa salina]
MTALRTYRPLIALFAVATLAAGCADDESPIDGSDESAGDEEAEGDTAEGGEGEGGEELNECIETVNVLADAKAESPEGHSLAATIDVIAGPHGIEFAAAEAGEGVSVVINEPEVTKAELDIVYEDGEVRYIESVAADGSEATCVSRLEADVEVRIASEDKFFDAEFAAVLVASLGEEELETPMIIHAVEDLAELGDMELVEIDPADPIDISYELSLMFAAEGLSGALSGLATYEDEGIDGDTVVSALGFDMFLFSV